MDEKIMKMFAAILAMRANYYNARDDHHAAVAYENAFEMLVYAYEGGWDYLRQFGFSDAAEDLIDRVGSDIDLRELREIINAEGNTYGN